MGGFLELPLLGFELAHLSLSTILLLFLLSLELFLILLAFHFLDGLQFAVSRRLLNLLHLHELFLPADLIGVEHNFFVGVFLLDEVLEVAVKATFDVREQAVRLQLLLGELLEFLR